MTMLINKSFIEKQFITRPGEKLLFAARRHIFSLLLPILSIVFFVIATIVVAIFLQRFVEIPIFILIGGLFFVILAAGTVFMKLIVDWFFYFYIITNFKILEVSYKPFFSKNVSVIPLDQMRCVEVTSTTYGFINTIYDIGDVSIVLDFLTHQDIFVMTSIASPQKTSIMLSDLFNTIITKHESKGALVTPIKVHGQDSPSNHSPTARRLIYQSMSPSGWS